MISTPAEKKASLRYLLSPTGERKSEVPILFVECAADRDEVTRRLDRRSALPDVASDATAEVYEMQRGEFEALTETPAANHVVVNTHPGGDR